MALRAPDLTLLAITNTSEWAFIRDQSLVHDRGVFPTAPSAFQLEAPVAATHLGEKFNVEGPSVTKWRIFWFDKLSTNSVYLITESSSRTLEDGSKSPQVIVQWQPECVQWICGWIIKNRGILFLSTAMEVGFYDFCFWRKSSHLKRISRLIW